MWKYNVSSDMIDLNRLKSSIKHSRYEVIELPIEGFNSSVIPEIGDEVALVYFNKMHVKGVVIQNTGYSYFVMFNYTF